MFDFFRNRASQVLDTIGHTAKKGWETIGSVAKPLSNTINSVASFVRDVSEPFKETKVGKFVNDTANGVVEVTDLFNRGYDVADKVVNSLERAQKRTSQAIRGEISPTEYGERMRDSYSELRGNYNDARLFVKSRPSTKRRR